MGIKGVQGFKMQWKNTIGNRIQQIWVCVTKSFWYLNCDQEWDAILGEIKMR